MRPKDALVRDRPASGAPAGDQLVSVYERQVDQVLG